MKGDWITGIDATLFPVLDKNGEPVLGKVNFGLGKFYPGGPSCMFRGKRVPYLLLACISIRRYFN